MGVLRDFWVRMDLRIRGPKKPNTCARSQNWQWKHWTGLNSFKHLSLIRPSPDTTGAGKRMSLTPRARLIDKDCNRRASCLGSASFDAGRLAWSSYVKLRGVGWALVIAYAGLGFPSNLLPPRCDTIGGDRVTLISFDLGSTKSAGLRVSTASL